MLFLFPSSHDHLYRLVVRPTSNKVILWSSMEDILTQALTTCLINIQKSSEEDKNALLYFCINQSSLVGGLRSSVHALNSNSVSSMVKTFMSDFHRFVNSNAEMALDKSFEIFFHVASSKDPDRPTNRRRAIPIRSLVGGGSESEKYILPGSLINIPLGGPDSPHCFKDSCLLASLCYSILRLRKPDLHDQVKKLVLKRSTVFQKNVAAKILMEEINNFCHLTGLPSKGPHDLSSTCKAFAELHKIQIIVIMPMVGLKPEFTCIPETFVDTMPRLYFLLQRSHLEVHHLLVIESLATFFNTRERAICFFCQSFYSCGFGRYKNGRHRCRNFKICQKCFGVALNPETVQISEEPWFYCDTNLSDTNDTNVQCNRCGVNFKSKQCHENHLRFCLINQYYWECFVCMKSVAMQGKDIKDLEKTHKCDSNEKFCPTCMKKMPLGHICPISKTEKTMFWPNLAVVSFMFEDANGSLCQVCYENQKLYMSRHNLNYKQLLESPEFHKLYCQAHQTKKCSIPNVIKLFYERDRFDFCGATFSNENFLPQTNGSIDNIHLSYCDNPLPKSNCSSRKRRSKGESLLNVPRPVLAISQFFNFILDHKLRNYTFLVQTNQEMVYILENILENFWQPTVIQAGRYVKKIHVADLDISFVWFENYCKGTLSELLQQFEIRRQVYYYPSVFNSPLYHGKSFNKPDFKYFQSFGDTPEQKNDKFQFYCTLPATISTNDFLLLCATENLKSFLLCVVNFVSLCFEVQNSLAHLTKSAESQAIHPLSAQIMSLSGFSMAILKYYYLNQYDICSVLRSYTGFASRVSSSEYEYLAFLDYTNQQEGIIHAFNSRDGQKKFDSIYVDGYATASRQVYQFNGCQVKSQNSSLAQLISDWPMHSFNRASLSIARLLYRLSQSAVKIWDRKKCYITNVNACCAIWLGIRNHKF